jgi:uncharacterized coiled-coil protein SlyX
VSPSPENQPTTWLQIGTISAAIGAAFGGFATLLKTKYAGSGSLKKLEAERDAQEYTQAEKVVDILRDLLAEERIRADKYQTNAERLADELSKTKQELAQCRAEVTILRKELRNMGVKIENSMEGIVDAIEAKRSTKREKKSSK